MRRLIWISLFFLTAAAAQAAEAISIAKIKKEWRALDGETAEQIIASVTKVAHLVPRGWEVRRSDDGDLVTFSWAKHSTDKEGDEYTITWEIASDGAVTLGPPYAKPMELGWQPFATRRGSLTSGSSA